MNVWKLGTIWGKGAPDFFDLIKEKSIALSHTNDGHPKRGDLIIITKGFTVKAITKLLEDVKPVTTDSSLQAGFDEYDIDFDSNVLYAKADWIILRQGDYFQYKTQDGICQIHKPEIIKSAKELFKKYKQEQAMDQYIQLLKYKHQVILQGPPGTGKTRLAKEIGQKLVFENFHLKISKEDIKANLKEGTILKTVKEKYEFQVQEVNSSVRVTLLSTGATYPLSLDRIIECVNNNEYINPDPTKYNSNVGPYILASAIYVLEAKSKANLELVQFHPAYSYEDFVRGIVVEANEGEIEYVAKNKILGDFATRAYKNWIDSQKDNAVISKEQWTNEMMQAYADSLQNQLESNPKISINNTAYIFEVEEDAFRYTGDNWPHKKGLRMKYQDIIKMYLYDINTRKEVKQVADISGLAIQHSSYYIKVLAMFREFLKNQKPFVASTSVPKLLNFVLIIDEINRANLPSVLGELIYALEYRGENVQSIYDIDGKRDLILPPNLYIIGTMNTADRSVSHIDYAIRRRFAFIDVLPSNKVISDVIKNDALRAKALQLYSDVSQLFTDKYLAADFEADAVKLGHSYFLAETEELLKLKLQYEIKPLLYEYLKDGILLTGTTEISTKDKIASLNV